MTVTVVKTEAEFDEHIKTAKENETLVRCFAYRLGFT